MTSYIFRYGDIVRVRRRVPLRRMVPNAFEVVGLLPPRDGIAQYRVKSAYEQFERILPEDNIHLAREMLARDGAEARSRQD